MTLFRSRTYRAWLVTDTSFAVAGAMFDVGLPLIVAVQTGSTVLAGSLAATLTVVTTLLILPGGSIVDHYDRRTLCIVRALIGAALFGAASVAVLTNHFVGWIAYALVIALGIRGALSGGTTDVMLRDIVAPESLPGALSVNQSRDSIIKVIASPVISVLMTIGAFIPFAIAAACNAVAALTSRPLPRNSTSMVSMGGNSLIGGARHTVVDMLQGFRLIRRINYLWVSVSWDNLVHEAFTAALMLCMWHIAIDEKQVALSGFVGTAEALGLLAGSLVAPWLLRSCRGSVIWLLNNIFEIASIGAVVLLGSASVPAHVWMIGFATSMLLFPSCNAMAGSLTFALVPTQYLGRLRAGIGLINLPINALLIAGAGFAFKALGWRTSMLCILALMVVGTLVTFAHRSVRDIPATKNFQEYARTHALNTARAGGFDG